VETALGKIAEVICTDIVVVTGRCDPALADAAAAEIILGADTAVVTWCAVGSEETASFG